MRKTDNKPTWKPAKILNKTPTHPKWISSEKHFKRRRAVKKAANYGLVSNDKHKEKLKAIVEDFSFYDPDEKYRLPDRRAIIDNLALSAKAFEKALAAVTDPKLRHKLELPRQYRLYGTHRQLLDMVQAYRCAAEKESDRLMNLPEREEKKLNRTLRQNFIERLFISKLAKFYENVTENRATATLPNKWDNADPIKFASFVEMMFKTLGVHKSENTISNQIKTALKN